MAHVDNEAMPAGSAGIARPEVGVAAILVVALAVLVLSRRAFRQFL